LRAIGEQPGSPRGGWLRRLARARRVGKGGARWSAPLHSASIRCIDPVGGTFEKEGGGARQPPHGNSETAPAEAPPAGHPPSQTSATAGIFGFLERGLRIRPVSRRGAARGTPVARVPHPRTIE